MTKARRMMGILAATAAAGVLPVLAASPAQASYVDCTTYMSSLGYIVGPTVQDACSNGENGFIGEQVCFNLLIQVGVKWDDATEACSQARRG
ncbi:hypothetical protein HYE82_14950 [Streptomyces sp. BR123]|jgi:hypothetical protein|uniref:hypothetical protein n=1 Tax=Streptomyces sp. BR123 TaxID=2749828 RepID=UPI0015C4E08D|nr:hypothetical protein [Streptomyces sp. BR123]NXY95665.1 hypothetical protein [Streptomyces sp. BR123]